ncbi:DMSO/TMAO reductase YedYZ, molybdopterin-dependent catalytic subunit [Mucilaginibacter gossypiicola]|uniref:DMSO/TMAO reductase YedYZ, molybdopterin-dependent catalytic subunit n=1 Tax=Mucilaginibacter gossypiicola TaxID=551995 RepID=A0A1H8ELJ2_9SPHI|nr:molybdopterin-dependent oxidoreductase [Mucilaginibacter gossypiicola]SEN19668.1 DMSO/TMAO reductase YedYZ, molybdopterin-dependent catalytic subunit [Mucilaginibacter gossypiicola]
MFTNFNAAEQAVHFPADRRLFLGIKPYIFVVIGILLLATVGVAWLQYLVWGLPADPSASFAPVTEADPKGFPWWLCLSHWVNFFFLIIIIRSGLSILADHPRLYWNNDCTPDSEWIKFTPLKIPDNKIWTAKDEARYLSPVVGLPGYRHTVGLARCWHFINVPFFLLNGVVFSVLLFTTNQWKRLVPVSWQILPDSWNVFVHYATLNMPVEPNGFYHYNALQQLSYFGVVFILAPVAMLSGMAMSPAIENRFHWLPKLFGNRQGARSVHFLVMLAYLAFIVIHVSMVAATGLVRNMNHIIHGTDSPTDTSGLYIGLGFILFIVAFGFFAHWLSWRRPRLLQKIEAFINGTLWKLSINKFKPEIYYSPKDISPYFWANGKIPESEEWRNMAADGFKDYKLKVGGLVDNPVELSITDLINLGKEQNITMHHCIQGWSGIAEWGGVPIKALVELVKPHANVTTVAFYSFGEGLYGGTYYDTHTLDNCMKPASILAWEMNYEPLTPAYGAPLRLRIENQLGYKMVKWIARVDFVESHETIGKGFGGKNEDDEYFDLIANT